jgi:hypothetical protein
MLNKRHYKFIESGPKPLDYFNATKSNIDADVFLEACD